MNDLDWPTPDGPVAVEALKAAEACTEPEHPNLDARRGLRAEAGPNPARSLVPVFIGDVDALVDSDADATVRATLASHGTGH